MSPALTRVSMSRPSQYPASGDMSCVFTVAERERRIGPPGS